MSKVDKTKPCRCGTGLYCHRHFIYGLSINCLTPKLLRLRCRGRPIKRRPDTSGGQS